MLLEYAPRLPTKQFPNGAHFDSKRIAENARRSYFNSFSSGSLIASAQIS